jgi:hypothetical protein
MAQHETVQRSKIVVQFVAPGENGAPNTVVGELEFIVDAPAGGAQ